MSLVDQEDLIFHKDKLRAIRNKLFELNPEEGANLMVLDKLIEQLCCNCACKVRKLKSGSTAAPTATSVAVVAP